VKRGAGIDAQLTGIAGNRAHGRTAAGDLQRRAGIDLDSDRLPPPESGSFAPDASDRHPPVCVIFSDAPGAIAHARARLRTSCPSPVL
jgi:hypothetical protein